MMSSCKREEAPAGRAPIHRARCAAAIATTVIALTVNHAARAGETPMPIIPIGLLSAGESITVDGFVGDGEFLERDVDVYSIELDAAFLPVRLTGDVETSEPNVDLRIRVFNADGHEIFNNDDASIDDLNPGVAMTIVEPGPIFVAVSDTANQLYDISDAGSGRAGAGGAYSLYIRLDSEVPPASSLEPNDSVFNSSLMGGESFILTGEFIGDGAHGLLDVDAYQLSTFGPVRVDVEVRAASIGSVLLPVVRLRACDAELLEPSYDDDCSLGFADAGVTGEGDVTMSALFRETSDVVLFVSGSGNARFDPAHAGTGEPGSTGYYDLIVTITPLDTFGPFEPNDSILTSAPLPGLFVDGRQDTVVVDGFIGDGLYASSRGDRDFYEVRVADEGRILLVEVTATDGADSLDPIVTAYDLEGRTLARNDNFGDSGDATLVVPAACGEIDIETLARSLVLEVEATKKKPTLNPFVPPSNDELFVDQTFERATGGTGAYRLTVSTLPLAPDCGVEPNDTLSTAVSTGIVGSGWYGCSSAELGDQPDCPDRVDVDIWSVEVTEVPATIHAAVSGCRRDAPRFFMISAYDSAGIEVASRIDQLSISANPSFQFQLFEATVETPGTFYLVVSGDYELPPWFDPNEACSIGVAYTGFFDIGIVVRSGPRDSHANTIVALNGDAGVSTTPLYATRQDVESNRIDAFDRQTGEVVSSIPAPESHYSGAGGLALHQDQLLYMGVGRYPLLYHIDKESGDVRDAFHLWMGSGVYTDAVMLGDELYILDVLQQSIHVVDPTGDRHKRIMLLGAEQGISIGGGLAALAGPNRLFIGDAFNTGQIYEVEPVSGAITGILPAPDYRPIALGGLGSETLYVVDWESSDIHVLDRAGDFVGAIETALPVGSLASDAFIGPFGDFDLDGDVDLRDISRWQVCFAGSKADVSEACSVGDATADGRIDLADAGALAASVSGP